MTCYRLRDGTEYISRLLGSVWHRVHTFAPVQVPHSGTKSRLPRFRGAAHVHLPLAVRGELSGPAAQQHAALAAAHRARLRVAHCERAPRAEARHGPRELRHSGNRTSNLGGMCEVSVWNSIMTIRTARKQTYLRLTTCAVVPNPPPGHIRRAAQHAAVARAARLGMQIRHAHKLARTAGRASAAASRLPGHLVTTCAAQGTPGSPRGRASAGLRNWGGKLRKVLMILVWKDMMMLVGHPVLESARPRLDTCGAAAQVAREQHRGQDVIRLRWVVHGHCQGSNVDLQTVGGEGANAEARISCARFRRRRTTCSLVRPPWVERDAGALYAAIHGIQEAWRRLPQRQCPAEAGPRAQLDCTTLRPPRPDRGPEPAHVRASPRGQISCCAAACGAG